METSLIAQSEFKKDYSGMTTMELGQVLAKSGYFADARDAAQAVVKVLAGRELGMGPVASMTGIYIVKGRVTLSANVMAAQIKRSGRYNYRVIQLDDTLCEIAFFEGKDQVGVSSMTMAQAKEANLNKDWDKDSKSWKEKATWKNFPRNMLFARAMSNGAKWYCPDVFSGPVYTPDELEGGDEPEVIDVVDETPRVVQVTRQEPDRTATLLHDIDEVLAKQGLDTQQRIDYKARLRERHGQSLTEAILKATLAKLENAAQKKALQKTVEEVFDASPTASTPHESKSIVGDPGAKNGLSLWREALTKNLHAFQDLAFDDDTLEATELANRVDRALGETLIPDGEGHAVVEDVLRYIERHSSKKST